MLIYHYSHYKLTSTKVSKHGTGINGAESKRKNHKLYLDRTYFGTKNYKPEKGLGIYKHETFILNSKIYDLNKDEHKFYDLLKNTYKGDYLITAIEFSIRLTGYRYIKNNDTILSFVDLPVGFIGLKEFKTIQVKPYTRKY